MSLPGKRSWFTSGLLRHSERHATRAKNEATTLAAGPAVRSRAECEHCDCLGSAIRLYEYLASTFWDGSALCGPDPGIRFNWRIGRFIKSYASTWPWKDTYYYLQAQAYWVLANWRLYELTRDLRYRSVAIKCSERMIAAQRQDGAWDYPNPEWKHRVATAEGTWASLGLLTTYDNTYDVTFLAAALRWYDFLFGRIGMQQVDDELAVNYFADVPTARVPNNTAFVLRFCAELKRLTSDDKYVELCGGMITFLARAQKPNGEFPYMVRGGVKTGKCWEHFQCYQYNAFECLDLMRYLELTNDVRLKSIISHCLDFLSTGVAEDGHAYYDCGNRYRSVTYHTAALAAAFTQAGRLGFSGYESLAARMFSYLGEIQKPNGTFTCSKGDYLVLRDTRAYPRMLSMILFHLLGTPLSSLRSEVRQ